MRTKLIYVVAALMGMGAGELILRVNSPVPIKNKIDVISGQTHGYVQVKWGKKDMAINLRQLRSFSPGRVKNTTEISLVGFDNVFIVNHAYKEVWKKVAQASRQ